MAHLFEPFTLKSVTLKNRIGVSPMCQYSSEEGHATDWHLIHLGSRAVGGAGLVIAEATAVTPEGRISPADAGLWQDSQMEKLAQITRFVKSQGSVAGIQLAHAGRKASAAVPWAGGGHLKDDEGGWPVIAPSAEAFGGDLFKVPAAMTAADIERVKEGFRDATVRAKEVGYQWLELHAAHGYLAHSFLSPLANKRTDNYGGSFDNRVRFVVETARAMRSVWPESLPFTARLSCSDWIPGGWTIEDSVELSKRLKAEGVDLIDCSSGFVVPDISKIPFGPGFQVPFAEKIRKEAGLPTSAVGMITDPKQADEIIRSGKADIVLLAREMLRNPYWAQHAAKDLGIKDFKRPVQYGRS